MTITEDSSLGDAKAWLRERLDDGEKCPCCTQFARVYRWSLYGTAVRALGLYERLGSLTPDGFVHTMKLKDHGHRGQGDASRLQHWGLVVRDTWPRDDGGRSGYWRVTGKGRDFLYGRTTIPKYVHVYDGRVLATSGPQVTVHQCLGRFSYDEIVRDVA